MSFFSLSLFGSTISCAALETSPVFTVTLFRETLTRLIQLSEYFHAPRRKAMSCYFPLCAKTIIAVSIVAGADGRVSSATHLPVSPIQYICLYTFVRKEG